MISVVVPAYNAESTIAGTIDSVIAQSCDEWEMVICDDGSSDSTVDVVESYKDPRIRLIRGERSGLPAVGRNRALEVAQGEYVAFLDADDLWEPSKLEGQLDFFAKHPECGLVFTRFLGIDGEGNVVSPNPTPDLSGFDNPGDFVAPLARNNMICNSSAMISRAACEVMGKIDESLRLRGTEDFDCWLKIAGQFAVGFLPTAEVRYRMHAQGISNNVCAMRRGAFLVVLSQLQGEAETYREAIATRAFQWAMAASAMRDREHMAEALSALETWRPSVGQKIQLCLSRIVPAKLLQKMMS
jgi:glycosyltransferase involved in cell wall biosynthesis